MQRAAIEKAKDRLSSAKARLKDLEAAKDYVSARRHWYDFLLSSNAVFSVLEQGAKSFGQSMAWFGEKKNLRRTDPLLSYLWHARNADEHGVPSVTELEQQKMVLMANGKPVAAIEAMKRAEGKGEFQGTFQPLGGSEPDLRNVNEIRVYPDRAKLIRVTDRGVGYDPPNSHLRDAIDEPGPITVATLMVAHVERLISEAEQLVAP